MIKNIHIGDYMMVTDKDTGFIVLAGKVVNITDNPAGYSIDNKIFINPNSARFDIVKCDYEIHIPYTPFNKDYIIFEHNNIDNTFSYDIFKWNEIEPEVKETVDLLNSLGFIETYSSCSGHNKIPSYIDFRILNYEEFFKFIHFLNKNGIVSYCTKHGELDENDFKLRFIIGVEGLNTCHLELVELNTNFDKLNSIIIKYKRFI